MGRLNNMLLNNQQVNKEIKEKNMWKQMKIQHKGSNLGCSKSNAKREIYSDTDLSQEIRKILNRQSHLKPKRTKKRRTKSPKPVEGRE